MIAVREPAFGNERVSSPINSVSLLIAGLLQQSGKNLPGNPGRFPTTTAVEN
jgi:hypothetical protein